MSVLIAFLSLLVELASVTRTGCFAQSAIR